MGTLSPVPAAAETLAGAMSPQEAADILDVEVDTIRQLRRKQRLQTVYVDRRTPWVTRESVEAYARHRPPRGRPKRIAVEALA
jgi:hypothetical protein